MRFMLGHQSAGLWEIIVYLHVKRVRGIEAKQFCHIAYRELLEYSSYM